MSEPFAVKDCALIAISTGEHAQTLRELKDRLNDITKTSIYYHFWGGLLRPRFDDPEYQNDFAVWSSRSLHDKILAERLAILDPTNYQNLDDLRKELIDIIDERLDESDFLNWMAASEKFYFVSSQIVIFDTGKKFLTPEDIGNYIPHLSRGSIFYHFIDARRRPPQGKDDFSAWLIGIGGEYLKLADQISALDPYFTTLTKMREDLYSIFSQFRRSRKD